METNPYNLPPRVRPTFVPSVVRPERRTARPRVSLALPRGLMIAIGVITIAASVYEFITFRNEIETRLRTAGPATPAMQVAMRIGYLIIGAQISVGVLFLIFATLVYRFPLPMTIVALLLYILGSILIAIGNPDVFLQGFVVRLLFIVGLGYSIHLARLFQIDRWLEEQEFEDRG